MHRDSSSDDEKVKSKKNEWPIFSGNKGTRGGRAKSKAASNVDEIEPGNFMKF